jgi:hypothetical protein
MKLPWWSVWLGLRCIGVAARARDLGFEASSFSKTQHESLLFKGLVQSTHAGAGVLLVAALDS